MKMSPSSLSVLASACVLWTGSLKLSEAATYYWDIDPNTAMNQNGSGLWTSDPSAPKNWGNSVTSGSHSNVVWENGAGHTATFGATQGYTNNLVGGTITLTENLSLARLDKSGQAGLYTITAGDQDYTITLTKGTGSNSTMIGNNHQEMPLVVDARLLGTEGFVKMNSGKVVLARDNEISGRVVINALGPLANPTSVLQIGNGGTTGTLGAAHVEFASDGNNATQSVFAWNRSDRVEMTNRLVSSTNAGRLNKGILQQMGTGTLVLNGDLSSFTGGLLVTQGVLTLGENDMVGSLGNASYLEANNTGIFRIHRSEAFTLDRMLRGNGVIEKLGANTLTVLQGEAPSTHSGFFDVADGTLSVGQAEALSSVSTVRFTGNATMDLQGFTQTLRGIQLAPNVTGTIVGSGDSHLILTGADWDLGAGMVDNQQVLDMSGLAKFTYDSAAHRIALGTTHNLQRNTLTVKLAQENLIRAKEFNLAYIQSGATFGFNQAQVELGASNDLFADLFNIGYTKSQVGLSFAANDGSSSVKIRATDGASRTTMIVGRGESGGLETIGRVDLSGGVSDLYFNRLVLGQNHNRETQGANTTGTFVMGAGLLDANQIVLGAISNTSTNTTYRGIGRLEIRNGGDVRAGEIVYGEKTGVGLGQATGTLSLIDGTLAARSIRHGQVANINSELVWTGGTLTHLDADTDLEIDDVTLRMGNGLEKTLHVGAGRTVNVLSNITNTSANAAANIFTKTGSGVLSLGGTNTYTGILSSDAGIVRATQNGALSGGYLFTGNSTLELGSTSHTLTSLGVANGVTGVVTGQKLRVQSTTNFTVQGTAANSTTKLDLSGLNEFEWIGASADIRWGSTMNTANNVSQVILAKSNTITARQLGLAAVVHGDTGGPNRSEVTLGNSNVFHLGTLLVGNFKSTAQMSFANTSGDKSLVLRGVAGGDSRAVLEIGINQSGAIATDATLDLTAGSFDARISNLTIGRSDNSGTQNRVAKGQFLMGKGLVDATNVFLGELTNNSSTSSEFSNARLAITDTGELRAENVIFGRRTTGGANSQGHVVGVLELGGGGTVAAKVIERGTATINRAEIEWKSGTLRPYDETSNLEIREINLMLDGSGERIFHVGSEQTISVQSSIFQGGQTLSDIAFYKRGLGTLDLHQASVYDGETRIEQGSVRVLNGSGSATGQGSVEVAAGAHLGGWGIISLGGNSSLVNRGTIAPKLSGNTGATQMTLSLVSSTGVFRNEGILAFDLYSNAGDNTSELSSSDRLLILGNNATNLQLSGSILLSIGEASNLEAAMFQEGDRWLLLDWTNSSSTADSVTMNQIQYQGASLAAGLGWELQSLSAGLYAVVVAVPEPSHAALLGAGAFGLLLRRRRH